MHYAHYPNCFGLPRNVAEWRAVGAIVFDLISPGIEPRISCTNSVQCRFKFFINSKIALSKRKETYFS